MPRPDAAQVAAALAPEVHRLVGARARVLLGLAGAPGAGKSTLAEALAADFSARHGDGAAVVVGMDGFHLSQDELERRGLDQVKGAPQTFDAAGFVALLHRLRESDSTIGAPGFDRQREETVPDAVTVSPRHKLVVVEGNYLLLDGPWRPVRRLLDRVWQLQVPEDVRVADLVARHVAHGREPAQARAWVQRSDEANARLVQQAAYRADALVDLVSGRLVPAR